MGRRKRKVMKPWCWYCNREFEDEKVLIYHQKSKHYRCQICRKKLFSAMGLSVHCMQVHKETITTIPNALPHRSDMDVEIFGMEGIPAEDVEERMKMLNNENKSNKSKNTLTNDIIDQNSMSPSKFSFNDNIEKQKVQTNVVYQPSDILPPSSPPSPPPSSPPPPPPPPPSNSIPPQSTAFNVQCDVTSITDTSSLNNMQQPPPPPAILDSSASSTSQSSLLDLSQFKKMNVCISASSIIVHPDYEISLEEYRLSQREYRICSTLPLQNNLYGSVTNTNNNVRPPTVAYGYLRVSSGYIPPSTQISPYSTTQSINKPRS